MTEKKRRHLLLFAFLLSCAGQVRSSTLSSPVTNRPDPFGPLPARTTNIFWVNRSGDIDYVDIIYKDNVIRRRLYNTNTLAGVGNIRMINVWNGTDDYHSACLTGTYDCKIKVSRSAVYARKIPPAGEYAEFLEPRDIDCDKYGNVYVLDRALRTVQKFSSEGALIWKHSYANGTGNGQLNIGNFDWGGLTVDTNLYYYISDQGPNNGRIQRFTNSTGNWSATYQAGNNQDNNFSGLGYDAGSNRLFTAALANADAHSIRADTMAGVIQNDDGANPGNMRDFAIVKKGGLSDYIFTVTGANVYRWARRATANGYEDVDPPANLGNGLTDTRSITARSNRYIYIAGMGSHQIRQLSTNGSVLETRGALGYDNTNFWAPSGIAWDEKNDLIWVSDTSNMRLVCYRENAAGNLEFVRTIESSPYIMRNPMDIAIDSSGNLYVVDTGFCLVKKFDQFGNFVMSFGGRGNGDGKFRNPRGIAVDDDGFIYVSDYGTAENNDAQDQIEKFDSSGNFVTAWDHADGRGMTSFVRNSSNFIMAIGETDGAGDDNAVRIYTPAGTVVQSFRDDDYGYDYIDGERDFAGNFYFVDAVAPAWVYSYQAAASGATSPGISSIGGVRAGIACDPYGTLWIPDQTSDDCEARLSMAVGVPTTLLYDFGGLGTGDGQFNNPAGAAIRMREQPGAWADLWIVDSANDRLQKFVINWNSEITEPVTIANTGAPVVTAAHPYIASSTNAAYIGGLYYTRQGRAYFEVYFSQVMNTNVKPTIQFISADNYTYDIGVTSYIGNCWIGTAWIPTGHDGSAKIRVENARNTGGTLISPDPTILYDAFIIDTVAPGIGILNPQNGITTVSTNITVEGNTEADARVDIYNWSLLTGGTLISSKSNVVADGSGYYMYNSLKLKTPKDSTNFITVRARDKAGNWSAEFSPRRMVRCINAIGFGYVEPSTNRTLGDRGNPRIIFAWQANAIMSNGTVTVDVPPGWAYPSTNRNRAGYVRLHSYAGLSFATGKTLWTDNPSYPRRFKVNFNSAADGGYFKIAYGTNTLTMVSNSPSTAIGENEWDAKATNAVATFTNLWDPPKKVGEYSGKTLRIPVIGFPVKVTNTNLMPSVTYKGASDVSACRLIFFNTNRFHADQIDRIILTVENAAMAAVNANTRLSSVSLYTSGIFYMSAAAGVTPYVTLDLSADPLYVPPRGTNRAEVRMNISPTTTATDIRLNLASKNDVTARNYANYAGVDINVTGTFPRRTTYARIMTNMKARRVWTSRSNTMPPWTEAGEAEETAMLLVLRNTNYRVNDVEVTKVYIRVDNRENTALVPDSVISRIVLAKHNNPLIYAQKSPVEFTADPITLVPTGLYIPYRTIMTCDVRVDIKSTATATNFLLTLSDSSNIQARDKLFFHKVTNFAWTGYSFPLRTGHAEVARYFRVEHDTLASVNTWEPVVFKVLKYNLAPVTNYSGVVTLDTDGEIDTIAWSNFYARPGILTDLGAFSDMARFAWSVSNRGVVTLAIRDETAETIAVTMRDTWLSVASNNLRFAVAALPPDIRISKSVLPVSAKPYELITYTIKYSNASAEPALGFELIESMPTNMLYTTNSAEISNFLHSGAASVSYATDFLNSVWLDSNFDTLSASSKIKRIRWSLSDTLSAGSSGTLMFKTCIR